MLTRAFAMNVEAGDSEDLLDMLRIDSQPGDVGFDVAVEIDGQVAAEEERSVLDSHEGQLGGWGGEEWGHTRQRKGCASRGKKPTERKIF